MAVEIHWRTSYWMSWHSMKILWVLLEQGESRRLLPSNTEHKICPATGKRLVPAVREMSLCWPCPVWFYWCIVCFLFKYIELVLNHYLSLCRFLQQGFSLSEDSSPFLYLPAVTSLVCWSDGHSPGGLAARETCLGALSLCKCRHVVEHDYLTHHARGAPLPPCTGQGKTSTPLLLGPERDPQGLGQFPTSLVDLGMLSSVLLIAATR